MKLATLVALTAFAAMLGTAQAQTPAPSTSGATTTMPAKMKKAPAVRSAKSKECSAQADSQGLHGKARKKFRHHCMRG